jgi:hypothetical protein
MESLEIQINILKLSYNTRFLTYVIFNAQPETTALRTVSQLREHEEETPLGDRGNIRNLLIQLCITSERIKTGHGKLENNAPDITLVGARLAQLV